MYTRECWRVSKRKKTRRDEGGMGNFIVFQLQKKGRAFLMVQTIALLTRLLYVACGESESESQNRREGLEE